MSIESLASVAQIIEAIAVVITVMYAWGQLKAMRQEQLLGAVWEIFRELDAPEKHEARNFIYRHAMLFKELELDPETNLAKLPEEVRKKANLVSSSFDRIGYVVKRGLIPLSLVLDGFHPSIARSWVALEPYIQTLRETTYHPYQEQYFEFLGTEALASYTSRAEVVKELAKWSPPSSEAVTDYNPYES